MCKSNCRGTCVLALQNKIIDSKEALAEVVTTINNMTGCSSPVKQDNKDIKQMNILIELKEEAKNLLEESNCYSDQPPHVFENAFKEKVKHLKEKISSLEKDLLQNSVS